MFSRPFSDHECGVCASSLPARLNRPRRAPPPPLAPLDDLLKEIDEDPLFIFWG
jgi:streptomycin 6-kinase